VTRLTLPGSLLESFEEVRTATGDMVRAARCGGDPDALREATECRGRSVQRLEALLREVRPRLDGGGERELQKAAEALTRQAEEAENVLAEALRSSRESLRSADKAAGAIRNYAVAPSGPLFERSR
jgi:hypothetical protein